MTDTEIVTEAYAAVREIVRLELLYEQVRQDCERLRKDYLAALHRLPDVVRLGVEGRVARGEAEQGEPAERDLFSEG